ncbi:hypothetical protein ACYSNL_06845, partial [Enterococcus cecorum]
SLMVLVDLIIEETDVFFYYYDYKKKIFSVILRLSNNTKYHRPFNKVSVVLPYFFEQNDWLCYNMIKFIVNIYTIAKEWSGK